MSYSVNPSELQDISGRAVGAVGDLESVPTDLGRLLRAVGEASGSPVVAAAALSAARRWQPAAEGMVREARGLARGLGAVGAQYEATERAQGQRFGTSP
ncbi:WXG100 family type VII secretion target [Demetria terragena]|uniref:WXG100 family type VII secretion target n=1 Tax=Demetria terragena TaxID=63959 RepID=UPI0003677981|nr:hypothetical protein [Demetria terragena]